MIPRPYQAEASNAIDAYFAAHTGNPCVVLPTGSGKTPCMAWKIQQYLNVWPNTRVLVLAHVKELLSQGVDELREIWPAAPIGIYSAGLNRKESGYSITYASIQSIFRHAQKLSPFDLIFVDEAHRIPLDGERTYRQFLADAKEWARIHGKPHQRVIGWTATPFRLDGGKICGPNYVLNDICYSANVADLIAQGYLCKLTSKSTKRTADVSGVHIRKGEFVASELMAVAGTQELVAAAVDESLARAADRKSFLFFCISVEHAQMVSHALDARGFAAPVVHAGTPQEERARIVRDFTTGTLRGVCNVNVFSEGFNAKQVDCVVLLRPTASAGLFYQQVGRGLRLHPSKADCLVLDFAGNTVRHGPIDRIAAGDASGTGDGTAEAPSKVCPDCEEIIASQSVCCPACGHEFPPREAKHQPQPVDAPIISEPEVLKVEGVRIQRHEKPGKPASMRVIYDCYLRSVSEFICFEHDGFAKHKAIQWWRRRFGYPTPATVSEAMSDMHLPAALKDMTESVTVRPDGKYYNVVSVQLKTVERNAQHVA